MLILILLVISASGYIDGWTMYQLMNLFFLAWIGVTLKDILDKRS